MAETPTPQSIEVKFSEAIEFLRRRLAIGSDQWMQLLAEEGKVSSAIADDTVRSVTQDLAGAALDAIENGTTLEQFRKDYARIVAAHGWSYHGNPGWHSRLVFRLNTGNAYAAGRWQQAQQMALARPDRPLYGRLVTAGDDRVRETHAEMHGIIRPIGDAYWDTHWPPNGFNCRCHVQILTDRDLQRYGWSVTPDGDPRLRIPPDPGWGYNPGVIGERLAQVVGKDDDESPLAPATEKTGDNGAPSDGSTTATVPAAAAPPPAAATASGDGTFPWPAAPRTAPFSLQVVSPAGASNRPGVYDWGLFEDEDQAQAIAAELLAGVPNRETLTARWFVDRYDGSLSLEATGPDSHVVRRFERDEDTDALSVEHAYFVLGEQYQGGGYGRRMMQQSLLTYERLGVERVTVHANIDVGGYAWARLGFAPNDPAQMRRMLQRIVTEVALPQADRDALLDIISHADDHELMYRVAGYRSAGGTRLGQRILMGSDWYGYIDLTDSVQLAFIAAALGG